MYYRTRQQARREAELGALQSTRYDDVHPVNTVAAMNDRRPATATTVAPALYQPASMWDQQVCSARASRQASRQSHYLQDGTGRLSTSSCSSHTSYCAIETVNNNPIEAASFSRNVRTADVNLNNLNACGIICNANSSSSLETIGEDNCSHGSDIDELRQIFPASSVNDVNARKFGRHFASFSDCNAGFVGGSGVVANGDGGRNKVFNVCETLKGTEANNEKGMGKRPEVDSRLTHTHALTTGHSITAYKTSAFHAVSSPPNLVDHVVGIGYTRPTFVGADATSDGGNAYCQPTAPPRSSSKVESNTGSTRLLTLTNTDGCETNIRYGDAFLTSNRQRTDYASLNTAPVPLPRKSKILRQAACTMRTACNTDTAQMVDIDNPGVAKGGVRFTNRVSESSKSILVHPTVDKIQRTCEHANTRHIGNTPRNVEVHPWHFSDQRQTSRDIQSRPVFQEPSGGVNFIPRANDFGHERVHDSTMINSHPVLSNYAGHTVAVSSYPAREPVCARPITSVDATNSEQQTGQQQRSLNIDSGPPYQSPGDILLDYLQMPIQQVTTFSGDPIEFPRFKSRVEDMILSKSLPESIKMARLMQLLSGRAYQAVKDLDGLPGGLQEAIEVLQRRFGEPYMVVDACTRSITEGRPLQNDEHEKYRTFADKLNAVYCTLRSMGMDREIGNTQMRQVVQRLPYGDQVKWRDRVAATRPRIPSFLELVEFVVERSEAVNDPVYGIPPRTKKMEKPTTRSGKSFASTAYSNEQADHCKERKASVVNHIGKHNQTYSETSTCLPHVATAELNTTTKFRAPEKEKDGTLVQHRNLGEQANALQKNTSLQSTQTTVVPACVLCKGTHYIGRCPQFQGMTVEQRRECVRINNLCYNCLKRGHGVVNCYSKLRCIQAGCGSKHHTLIHPIDNTRESSATTAINYSAKQGSIASNTQVLPVEIRNAAGKLERTYALLDSGSNCCFIESDIAEALGLEGNVSSLVLHTLHGNEAVKREKVSFEISSPEEGSERLAVNNAVVLHSLNLGHAMPLSAEDVKKWPYLARVRDHDLSNTSVKIIIGTDCPRAFVPLDYRIGGEEDPLAVMTPLGWTVIGPTKSNKQRSHTSFFVSQQPGENADMVEVLNKLYDIEKFCLLGDTSTSSVEDALATRTLEEQTVLKEGHYEVPMLWRVNCPKLPNNRGAAVMRLRCTEKRLRQDEDMRKKYEAGVNDYIEKGYATKVSDEAIKDEGVWYLPHHPVINPKKPEKVRVVFDAAASFQGESLNSQLLQGPDLMTSLVGILVRFRQEPVAIKADIEAMFHQVRVPKRDTSFLRFLWWDNGYQSVPSEYQMNVHIFGAKSSPCCASYALKRTAMDNAAELGSNLTEVVLKSFYVDDFLKSLPDTETALKVMKTVKEIVARGGFNLTKWQSNSVEVRCETGTELTTQATSLDLESPIRERTLGIAWNVTSDIIEFDATLKETPPTKRGILSALGSLFDPLGFLAPIVLVPRKIIQQLWKNGYAWDDLIPDDLANDWSKWVQQLNEIKNVHVPRHYIDHQTLDQPTYSLHVFADASSEGYGCVSYLRATTNETVLVSFVFGKSRVAPVKAVSIPRLELQASLLATRIGDMLREQLDFQLGNVIYWTDSATVMGYIQNTKTRFHTFVANRVAEIRERSTPSQWRYVPGRLNPADAASRGMTAKELSQSPNWFAGPTFLHKSEQEWPTLPEFNIQDNDIEVKCAATKTIPNSGEANIESFVQKFSDFTRLKRVSAWIIRIAEKARQGSKDLTVEEVIRAECQLLKAIQREHFQTELCALHNGQLIPRSSPLAKINPCLIENLVRVGGRLEYGRQTFARKHPVVIPRNSHVAVLIVRMIHVKLLHAGVEATVSSTFEGYWVLGCRAIAKAIIRQCIICRRQHARPMEQLMAPLPAERITPCVSPFTVSGVDYFGPIEVKIGRKGIKRWGVLFTCFATRACHLDVAPSLEADDFVNVLRRFIARRGVIREIWSDNGTNFIGAQREIREALQAIDPIVKREMMVREIKWRLQPPSASHMSGVWERMIRSAKRALNAVAGTRSIDDYRLLTFLAEAEYSMNSRPLTAVSDDPMDLEALTPNHILLLKCETTTAFSDNESFNVRKKWQQVQALAEHFWKRWSNEYIRTLQERAKWTRPMRECQLGDLVLLSDQNQPRNKWPIARVVKVCPSKDGHVRTVEVKTAHGTYARPITKLCLLESAAQEGSRCKA